MAKFGIGQAVRRVEDQRFVTGAGRYIDDIAAPEGRKPAERHRKDEDEQDADCEARQRHAEHGDELQELRERRSSPDSGVDADRDADHERQHGRDDHELEGRRKALGDQRGDVALVTKRNAEIALRRIADEGRKLQHEAAIEAKPATAAEVSALILSSATWPS